MNLANALIGFVALVVLMGLLGVVLPPLVSFVLSLGAGFLYGWFVLGPAIYEHFNR